MARLWEKPIAQIASELDIAESGLRRWMAQADTDEGRQEGLTSNERRKLVEGAARTGCWRRRTIRKQASADLAREDVLPKIEGRLGSE